MLLYIWPGSLPTTAIIFDQMLSFLPSLPTLLLRVQDQSNSITTPRPESESTCLRAQGASVSEKSEEPCLQASRGLTQSWGRVEGLPWVNISAHRAAVGKGTSAVIRDQEWWSLAE